jgi:5-methylthioadenosine/S-adenosylhomocysteine deaminase
MTRRRLIAGGCIVTVDPVLGDLPQGDILIEGNTILAIAPAIVVEDCEIIDAAGMIVMPGFVDTHRHTWQSCIRHGCCDMTQSAQYFREILFGIGSRYRPEDVYIGNLLGAVSALEAGTTTMLDWSHIINTPEHADAAIEGLEGSGIRAVFGHGWPLTEPASWMDNSSRGHPDDIRRLREHYFASDDGLITLAMAARGPEMTDQATWQADLRLARELGLRSTIHMGAAGRGPKYHAIRTMHVRGALGPDLTFVHCNTSGDDEIRMMADAGVTASLGVQVEQMTAGYGDLPVDRLLEVGIKPSLSSDTETKGAGDMFSQMRLLHAAYRAFVTNGHSKARHAPETLTTRDVLECATIVGARANGLEARVGSLTPGKRADIIFVRATDLNLMPVNDPVAAIVVAAHPGNVDSVMIDGRFRKRHGVLIDQDLTRIRDLARASQQYLTGR